MLFVFRAGMHCQSWTSLLFRHSLRLLVKQEMKHYLRSGP